MSRWVIAGLCAMKAVDVADRGGLGLGVWWLLAAIVVAVRPRAGVLLVPLAMGTYLAGVENQHLWLFMLFGVLLTLNDPALARTVLRWQVTILYGFAAVAKLTVDYLSGEELRATAQDSPLVQALGVERGWVVLALLGLATEAWLAVGLWRCPRLAIPVGVAFHASLVVFMAGDPVHAVRLAVFGGLVLAMYPAFLGRGDEGGEVVGVVVVAPDLVEDDLRA